MSPDSAQIFVSDSEKTYLQELSRLYPTAGSALSRIALLESALTLPKGTVHVISDVHGEYKKLKHVINNASGSLRMLVARTLGEKVSEPEVLQLLNFIHYPHESYNLLCGTLSDRSARKVFLKHIVSLELELLKELRARFTIEDVEAVLPSSYRALFKELLSHRELDRADVFLSSIVEQFIVHNAEEDLLRLLARVVRNLLVTELVVAGDLGDRGERIDRVIEYLMRQPNVSITWGNHDVSWMGACLGDRTCIATVLRFSLRYSRTEQLEEGYGISLAPLEVLAREVYGADPADRFACKGESWRDPKLMARMQKAATVILLKLEGQTILRNPHYHMRERALLEKIDLKRGSVELSSGSHELVDRLWPTLNPENPYALSLQEQSCIERLRESFIESPMLWRHMTFVARHGCMHLRRDKNLIFHGCVPCDSDGRFLSMNVDGESLVGKALFHKLNAVVSRAFREKRQSDLDVLWYLWCGAESPLFGKNKMATFESHFIAEKELQREHNNSYFELIHSRAFCARVLSEFGVDKEEGLIVNGHIPVKIDQGESPLKRSAMAVTIDGAFSESYGDKGYTLILDAAKTALAQHHHFESVQSSITKGTDIIPTIQELRSFNNTRAVTDTEQGDSIRAQLKLLNELLIAYRNNTIREAR